MKLTTLSISTLLLAATTVSAAPDAKKKTPAPKAPATTPTPTPAPPPQIPPPQPDATPDAKPPEGKPEAPKTNANENLQTGQTVTDRPWAKGVPEDQQKKALELFRDGNRDLNDGAYVVAAKKYREALTHWKHPAIHYNLALALLQLDNPLDVYENLNEAIKYGEAPLEKEKFDKAKEYIKVIETSSIATVEVTCNKPGAEVLVDGKAVFTAPGKYTAKVRAGKHIFSAEPGKNMQGYTTKVKAPFIDPGSKYRVELKLYTTDELTRYHRRWERTWAPWAVVGVGVVAAGVGGLLALSAKSSYDDFDAKVAACNSDHASDGGCEVGASGLGSLRESGDTKRMASFIGYGVGGAAVALGLTLVYLNRQTPYQIRGEDFEEEQDAKTSRGGVAGLQLAPMVSGDTAGAMVFGRF